MKSAVKDPRIFAKSVKYLRSPFCVQVAVVTAVLWVVDQSIHLALCFAKGAIVGFVFASVVAFAFWAFSR
jgi:hypothetical protein